MGLYGQVKVGDAWCHCLRSYTTGKVKLVNYHAIEQLRTARMSSVVLTNRIIAVLTTAPITALKW